jgi:hypothetical protein
VRQEVRPVEDLEPPLRALGVVRGPAVVLHRLEPVAPPLDKTLVESVSSPRSRSPRLPTVSLRPGRHRATAAAILAAVRPRRTRSAGPSSVISHRSGGIWPATSSGSPRQVLDDKLFDMPEELCLREHRSRFSGAREPPGDPPLNEPLDDPRSGRRPRRTGAVSPPRPGRRPP